MLVNRPDYSLYTRRSQNEANDPHLLDHHRALLLRTAAADGISIPPERIYTEIGTGERIASRPHFERLLSRWERLPERVGGLVYVTELSRLSRGLPSDQGRVMDALMRAAIQIRTPSRRYDLSRFDDRFQFMALALVANAELELIKQRFANGKQELLLQGRLRNARVPFGYRWNPLTKQPEAAETFPILVRCCQEAFTTSVSRLAERYGVPVGSLYKALRSPTICGWPAARFVITRELDRSGRPMTRLLPREEWRWPEAENNDYPHACSRAEWERLQIVLHARWTKSEKTAVRDGWAVDVVRFEDEAGAQPPGVAARRGSYTGRGVYALTYEWKPADRPRLYIARGPVNDVAEAALRQVATDPTGALAARRQWAAQLEAGPEKAAPSLIADRARRERHLVELLERELDASPTERRTIQQLRRQIEGEVEAIGRALQEAAAVVPPSLPLALPEWLAAMAGPGWEGAWAEAPDEEKRVVCRLFIQEIRVQVLRLGASDRDRRRIRTVLPARLWGEETDG